MEKAHRARLRRPFASDLNGAPVTCLDIPDDYRLMERSLVDLLERRMKRYWH